MSTLRPILFALLFCTACSTEIDVYAPAKETYYIVGVLDPERDTQYVSMTRVFQSDGDAYIYADTANLSARGWQVTLAGGGKTWEAFELEIPRDSGMFGGRRFAYTFLTDSTHRLQSEIRYDLTIRKPTDSTFVIRAYTIIPTEPILNSPSQPIYSAQSNTYLYPTFEFKDDVDMQFDLGTALGFEGRLWVRYLVDGLPDSVFWGPTRVRQKPFRCPASPSLNQMCIEFQGLSITNYIRAKIAQESGQVSFPDTTKFANNLEQLSRVARVEITAVDTFLTRFLIGNDPGNFGLNLLMDKLDYSNISEGHYGIFGSINRSSRWIFLGSCTKYLCGLATVSPNNCP